MFGFLAVGKAIFVTTLAGLGPVGFTFPGGVPNSLNIGPTNTSYLSCASGQQGSALGTTSTASGTSTNSQLPTAATCANNAQGLTAYQHCKAFLNASTSSTSSAGGTSTSSSGTQSSTATGPSSYGVTVSGACSQASAHDTKGLAAAAQGRAHQPTTSTTASAFSSSITEAPQSSNTQSGPPAQIPAGPGQGAGNASSGHGGH